MAQKPLAFFHVMKCGGTSVRAGLATGAAGRRHGPEVFELDGSASRVAAGGTSADEWKFRDALLPYALLTLQPAIVMGHFRYRDRYEKLFGFAHMVTVLRDPLERLVSLYKWRRYKPGIDRPVSLGFDELLASGRWEKAGHDYVDIFCGNDDLDPHSEAASDAAVANLRRFAVVGFLDRLDEFANHVAACLGKPVTIPMLNRSPAPDDAEIDPASLERARELCAPDYRVYDRLLATRVSP
ncbi:MAG: hypothetical protein QOF28_2072 [Actinomycetota bacterium]|jgi:hypothetical protein|nr:hypothetical protein [Actinomycetota bacterium]